MVSPHVLEQSLLLGLGLVGYPAGKDQLDLLNEVGADLRVLKVKRLTDLIDIFQTQGSSINKKRELHVTFFRKLTKYDLVEATEAEPDEYLLNLVS
jgi:hypothetical protein